MTRFESSLVRRLSTSLSPSGVRLFNPTRRPSGRPVDSEQRDSSIRHRRNHWTIRGFPWMSSIRPATRKTHRCHGRPPVHDCSVSVSSCRYLSVPSVGNRSVRMPDRPGYDPDRPDTIWTIRIQSFPSTSAVPYPSADECRFVLSITTVSFLRSSLPQLRFAPCYRQPLRGHTTGRPLRDYARNGILDCIDRWFRHPLADGPADRPALAGVDQRNRTRQLSPEESESTVVRYP